MGSMTKAQQQEAYLAQLRWRCRRGLRELDVILMNYFDLHFLASSASRQQAFVSLLELQDPVILSYLTGAVQPKDPAIADIIQQLARSRV
ncbi:MAG: succinate dehydrogenase assembly factor 2 [Steroidobacter sp.]